MLAFKNFDHKKTLGVAKGLTSKASPILVQRLKGVNPAIGLASVELALKRIRYKKNIDNASHLV